MAYVFKTLFEVKLLHEFYLTEMDGTTIFSGTDAAARMAFLMDQFTRGRASISQDLLFEFPASLREAYEGYQLKLLPAYSGFKVAARVNPVTRPDGALVYEPFVTLPDELDIHVLFTKRNDAIDRYSNLRISHPVPGMLYFSNDTVISDRVAPYLTNAISQQRSGYTYEQGELASFGPGDARLFYRDGGGDQWVPLAGSGFANENDRMLLPLRFYYSFPAEREVKEAEFKLKNKNGELVHTIQVTSSSRIDKTVIDLVSKKDALPQAGTGPVSDRVFRLEVNGDDGYSNVHSVIFNDELYDRARWAAATIRVRPSDDDLGLLTGEGYLHKTRNALGIWTEAPIFEIPVPSRFTYWKVINEKGLELKLTPDLTGYFNKENNVLVSKRPRSIAQFYFSLKKNGGTDPKYFPNPVNYDIKKDMHDINEDTKDRLYLDIMVPRSDLFPIEP